MFEVSNDLRAIRGIIFCCLDLILGTYRLEGSKLFWSMVVRIQIESHPIVSWKFSYLTHRLLRDGHRNVISFSFHFII